MVSIIFFFQLRKDVYTYDHMDKWENFNETSLSEKEEFYNSLNMEDITERNYMHAKRVCKNLK